MQIRRLELIDDGTTRKIKLHPCGQALVSLCDYEQLNAFHWRRIRSGHKYYAARRIISHGKTYTFQMHREIAKPKAWQVTHHKNRDTLDNRRENLTNYTQAQHDAEHITREI